MAQEQKMLRLVRLLEAFRQHDPMMPMQYAAVFARVAASGVSGTTSRQLQNETGLSQSSISRAASTLSKTDWRGKPGLDMLDERPDPDDPRRLIYRLNHRGRVLADALSTLME